VKLKVLNDKEILMQGEKTFKILDYSLNTIYDHKEKSIDKIIKVNKIGEEITCLYAHNWV
jgi:hypothetical protein